MTDDQQQNASGTDIDTVSPITRATIDSLAERHRDAGVKATQYENTAHQMRLELKRMEEAAAWQRRVEKALARRVITMRASLRAWEDEQSGIFEDHSVP